MPSKVTMSEQRNESDSPSEQHQHQQFNSCSLFRFHVRFCCVACCLLDVFGNPYCLQYHSTFRLTYSCHEVRKHLSAWCFDSFCRRHDIRNMEAGSAENLFLLFRTGFVRYDRWALLWPRRLLRWYTFTLLIILISIYKIKCTCPRVLDISLLWAY